MTFTADFADALAATPVAPDAGAAASPAYTRIVLEAAESRPSELLLACANGRVVGRAMAATSHARPGTAVIGLFELEPGPCLAATGELLIAGASEWATRTGHDRVFAPVDLTTWFNYRFMLPAEGNGAAVPPFGWEPAQRPAYITLFRDAGFADADRYRTVGATLDDAGPFAVGRSIEATRGAYETAVAAGYAFERLGSLECFASVVDELHPLCTDAFRDNPLFEQLPLATFRRLYAGAAASRDSTLSHVVRRPDGRLAGFVFAFVDRGDVIVKTIAVTRDVRGRRLSTALTHLVLARGAERGHRAFVSALVRAGNTSQFLSEPHLRPGMRSWSHEYVLLHRRIR
jgi:hypothetical protein